jgi:1,4-dihydroxy-2-naphthoyl-CoA hydrolase
MIIEILGAGWMGAVTGVVCPGYREGTRALAQADGMNGTTPYASLAGYSIDDFHAFGREYFPGWLGIELLSVDPRLITCRVRPEMVGPHGYVHGGSLASIADSLCGYGAIINLPPESTVFLTTELKINCPGALRAGCVLVGEATPLHLGRATQVWDSVLFDETTQRKVAVLRCTQLVLNSRGQN